MSDSVGRIDLDLGINKAGFTREIKGVASGAAASSMGTLKSLGAKLGMAFGLAFVGQKLFNFGKAGVELASNLAEVQNVVDVTFGSMAANVNAWSKGMLTEFGLSELSAKKFASTMGAMLKSSGMSGRSVLDMSKGIAELSADMASFYNLGNEEAFDKIRSGISGETEPLKRLGINMSVANMEAFALSRGIKKSYQEMSQAEQVMLRYNYLLNSTKDAQGDFARTSDSWANQTKLLGEQWKIFQGTMGAGFMAALTPVVKGLNLLIQKLQVAATYFKQFAEMIFGQAQTAKGAVIDTSVSMDDLGASTSGVGKSTKKAGKAVKGALAGFDQLNILSQSTAESMDDISAGAMDMGGLGNLDDMGSGALDVQIDTSSIEKFKSILDGLKQGLQDTWKFIKDSFGPAIRTVFEGLAPVIQGWKDLFSGIVGDVLTLLAPLKSWFVNSLVPAIQTVIPIIGTMFSGTLDTIRTVFQGIWESAFPVIEWFVVTGLPMLTEFAVGVWQIFGSIFDVVKTVFDSLWVDAIQPGLMIVSGMVADVLDIIKGFWDKWGKGIFEGIKEVFTNVKEFFVIWWENMVKPFITNMLEMFSWLWEKHLKGLVEEITNFIGKLVQGVLDIYNKFISPIVKFLAKELGPVFADVFSFIGDVVGTAVAVISDVVQGIFKALGGVIDFIVGIFTGDWKKAWTGISDIFGGIWDGILGVFKGVINLIIDAINFLIRRLNKVKIDVPDWLAGVMGIPAGQGVGFNIATIPKLASGGIVSQPTLAMIGEGNKKEAVVPLENSQFIAGFADTVAKAVATAMGGAMGGGGDTTVVMKVGESELGRATIRAINNVQRQTGVTLLTI